MGRACGLRLPLLSFLRDTRQAVPKKAAPSLPLHLSKERGGDGAQDGSPHPGKYAQMNSVVFALHAQAHCWLHAQEPWSYWTLFHLPQNSPHPHFGKGKGLKCS